MNLRTKFAQVTIIAVIAGALTACSVIPAVTPDLTKYYVLTTAIPFETPAPTGTPPRILLRPVVVPEFLRGRIMQVRVGRNEVRFIDNARWAEPLESGLNRVLAEDLGQRAGAVRLVARGIEEHDFEVLVHIRQFEGGLPAGAAAISAHIEIYSADPEPKLLLQDDFTSSIPGWDGKDHGQLADKLSAATAAMAEKVITLIRSAKG
jgi:uncharacterized lipoprotein YmbA